MTRQKLFIFDLDFTIWDAGGTWCDHLQPPFRKTRGIVIDSVGRHIRLYPDVPEILHYCEQNGFRMAIASRTYEPDWAHELLRYLNICHYFFFKEIFPASKIQHFLNLQNATNLTYDAMIFFDDEKRNIDDVRRLGVHTILVRDGLCWDDFDRGLQLLLRPQ